MKSVPILKLEAHDEAKELEFEIEYQRSLSFEQRFRMMIDASDRIAKLLLESGQRERTAIVKRP